MKNPWVIIGVLAVVLIGGSVWYSGNVSEKNNEGVVFSPNIKGNPDAPVILTEYSDFQCPACASFEPVIKDILAEYGDQVSLEYKHFPLPIHNLAETAARAAEAAGQQGAFFEYSELLFANQKTWASSPSAMSLFTSYAKELGLDLDKFKRHVGSSLIRDKVKSEGQEARNLGLTGTPSFLLNGQKMSFQTYEDFKGQIEAALNPEVQFELSQ